MLLCKPLRSITPALTLAVGAYFEPTHHVVLSTILTGAIGAALIYCSIGALNDLADMDTDAINAPDRPLVSGRHSPAWAASLSVLSAGFGLALCFYISFTLGLLGLLSLLLGVVYCLWAKRNIVSYFVLGLTQVGLPFLAGASLAGGPSALSLVAAAYLYATTTAQIAVKDLRDAKGDLAVGMRTLPAVAGVDGASKLVALGVMAAPLTFWIPGLFLGFSPAFFAAYALTGLLKLACASHLWNVPVEWQSLKVYPAIRTLVWCESAAWVLH